MTLRTLFSLDAAAQRNLHWIARIDRVWRQAAPAMPCEPDSAACRREEGNDGGEHQSSLRPHAPTLSHHRSLSFSRLNDGAAPNIGGGAAEAGAARILGNF